MAIKSKTPKETEVEFPFEIGQTVSADLGAGEVNCEVTNLDRSDPENPTIEITDSDGAKYDVDQPDWENLTLVKPEPEKPKKGLGKGKADAPAKKSKQVDSFAGHFKSTPAAPETSGGFPEGQWEAIVVSAERVEGEKGQSVAFGLVGVNADDVSGLTASMRYFIIDEAGEPSEGMGYMKRDLAKMMQIDVQELEEQIDSVEAFDNILNEFGEQQVWIEVNVREQKNKSGYMNYFLKDVLDQDNKPEVPSF